MMLSDQQRIAVGATERRVMVKAGPGSGKTHVLTERVRHLLSSGESPESILVFTFTRNAAQQLVSRLSGIGGRRLWIGTLHSICMDLLRQYGGDGYQTATIIDPRDSEFLAKKIITDYRLRCTATEFERGLRHLHATGEYPEASGDLRRAIDFYRSDLEGIGCLDYGEILLRAIVLLRTTHESVKRWKRLIRHVLVDEVQDCDPLHYMIIDEIADGHSTYCIGDPNQSIYGFRGARPDLMNSLANGLVGRSVAYLDDAGCNMPEDVTTYSLNESYRCSEAVLYFANRIIPSDLVSVTGDVGMAEIMSGRSVDVANKCKYLIEKGYSCGEIAVIARTNTVLRRLEHVFDDCDIPCFRPGKKHEDNRTPMFIANYYAMRSAVNPKDEIARYGCPDWLTEATEDEHILEIDTLDRVIGLDESVVGYWQKNYKGKTTAKALADYALRDNADDMRDAGDRITLITAHSSKGLEWPVVIVVGLNEDQWPMKRSIKESGDDEEERRLFFVAATRAKKELYVHYRRPGDQSEKRKRTPPSRFIEKLI